MSDYYYSTSKLLEITKKKLKDAILKRSEMAKKGEHLNRFEEIEYEYLEALFMELECASLIKSSVYNKEKHKRVMSEPQGEDFLLIDISVKGKYNMKKIEDWLNNE